MSIRYDGKVAIVTGAVLVYLSLDGDTEEDRGPSRGVTVAPFVGPEAGISISGSF